MQTILYQVIHITAVNVSFKKWTACIRLSLFSSILLYKPFFSI